MKFRESNKFLFSLRYAQFLKQLGKKVEPIEIKIKPLQSMQVGILFEATDIVQKDIVINDLAQLFEKKGAKVVLLGFFNHEADTSGIHFKHFNLKDINRYFIPQNTDINKFLETKFDMIINADISQSLPIHYLACKSQSITKVGPHSEFDDFYHLILDTKDTFTIKQYISELIDILNKVSFNGRL
ncbi:MAG: hypothetical protein ABI844_01295 [Saprospiraceae bacterium]